MSNLSIKYNNYQNWLWSKDDKKEFFLIGFIKDVLQVISALISDLKQGQLSLRAMSLVYTTIISIVPLFAISFSVLKGLGAHNQIRPFLLNALEPLGDKGVDITDKMIGFVDNIQVGVLGALGIVILIYTVIGMMQKMEYAFNYVWHVSKARGLAKRFNDYLSVLLIGPLLIFVSTAMTTSARSNYFIEKFGGMIGIEMIFALVGVVIPYLILALAFTFLYSFVPNTKVNWKCAFIGGLMTAFIWKIMGWGFANFVANSSNHAAIYSAFATIIVFMVWIYLVWLVLLIGASIGFYAQYPEYRRVRHDSLNLSPLYKEAIAMAIMVEIGKRFHQNKEALGTGALAGFCGQPKKIIEDIAELLKKDGIIIREEDAHSWVPSRPLEHINSYDIINAVRINSGGSQPTLPAGAAQKYVKDVDATLKKSFQRTTLYDLVKK